MPRSTLPICQTSHQLLLVDDDVLIRETLVEFLHSEGFQVVTAQDGEIAEQLLREANPPFDLVLTDLVMPGKSGMDVLRAALQINPSCTVLVLSGFGSVREANEAMDLGAYGLVNKPFHLDQFRNILRRLMERIALLEERDRLRTEVASLQARVELLEATKGRMEMLAQRFSPAPETRDDYLEGLERLADLRTRGLLSEAEYDAAKRGHLAKWRP
ncbi:MAG: two component, sigma54 specific, transcriptional regulator, Fis family [Holophagaceae bacterium]|nr:two component, sigma54 specific, transcriptional regulator, Fis family [Holophagaceae bacterium]